MAIRGNSFNTILGNGGALAALIGKGIGDSQQAQDNEGLAVKQANDMIPVDVSKANAMIAPSVAQATAMAPVSASAAGQEQAAKNSANMGSLKQLQDSAPDGAQIKAGDLSTGVDPMAHMMMQNQKGSASALMAAQKTYMSGLPKIQDQANAAGELMDLANDPKNQGSLGQARTMMLKSMGMNRYNSDEAKSVLGGNLGSTADQLFNAGSGGDNNPLTDSQKQMVNQFAQTMLSTAKQKHDQLKANANQVYGISQYADPAKVQQLQQSLGSPMDSQFAANTKKYQNLPTTQQGANGAAPQPTGLAGYLQSILGKSAPAPQTAPAAAPTMSFEEFQAARKAGKI
jgi:hypothetical protein